MNDTDIKFLAISRVSDKRILLTYADPATKKAFVDEVSFSSTLYDLGGLHIALLINHFYSLNERRRIF